MEIVTFNFVIKKWIESLNDVIDERELVKICLDYCRAKRKAIETLSNSIIVHPDFLAKSIHQYNQVVGILHRLEDFTFDYLKIMVKIENEI